MPRKRIFGPKETVLLPEPVLTTSAVALAETIVPRKSIVLAGEPVAEAIAIAAKAKAAKIEIGVRI